MVVDMDVEKMYTLLRGVTGTENAKFDVILKWFQACQIVDGRNIDLFFFTQSYERICPNRDPMTLIDFIKLLAIFARLLKQRLDFFYEKFYTVNDDIYSEIRERVTRVRRQQEPASL